jgi:CheY-like chemotaxis protein
MHILILIAAVWGGFFLLSLGLAAANSRSRATANGEPTTVDFKINPLLLPGDVEQLNPLRDIIKSKLNSTDRHGRRSAAESKELIFVVDDDPDILNLIKHVLDLEGFEVRPFTDPEEALAEFTNAQRRPEMVVTDYCMEPMNGLELITRCRQAQPDVKSIVISGMVDEHDFRKFPAAANQFLAKPFKVSNLIQTLNETLTEVRN